MKGVGDGLVELKAATAEAEAANTPEDAAAAISAVDEKLDIVTAKVEAVEALTASGPRRERERRGSNQHWFNVNEWLREATSTKATHTFERAGGSAALHLRVGSAAPDARYLCTVKTPTGAEYAATTGTGMGQPWFGVRTYALRYPDESHGSEPFSPGLYEVEWRSVPATKPTIANVLGTAAQKPIARDAFSIPDRPEAPRSGPTTSPAES